MRFVDIDEEIQRLQKTDWGKAVTIAEMADAFPDLKLFRDCHGRLRFCSREALLHADDVELVTCYACSGMPLEAWPYVVADKSGARLYIDPPRHVVAHHNANGFGEVPVEGWEEKLQADGWSEKAIKKIKQHLTAHPPIFYRD